MAASRRRPQPSTAPGGSEPAEIDTTVAHGSRIYDYLLGGTTNFAIDRQVAHQVADAFPGGLDNARAHVRAIRAFLVRTVRYLAAEAGIRQFLDIGTGIPSNGNVHTVAQTVAPESRVVYVDYDRIVQAHARTLLQSTREGATDFVVADVRDPERVLEGARATLDLGQPMAILLVGILHAVPEDAHGIVARLVGAVPPGSYLAIAHIASDIHAGEMSEALGRLNERAHETFVGRDRAEVTRFFGGLELLEPGVVPVNQWRPSAAPPTALGPQGVPVYGAVGRKR